MFLSGNFTIANILIVRFEKWTLIHNLVLIWVQKIESWKTSYKYSERFHGESVVSDEKKFRVASENKKKWKKE